MTFFEAAIEVLRTVQRPLDYKTITQFAINRRLLWHVGHTPDIVMASCLLRAIQNSDTGSIIRLPSGEFALRGWSQDILSKTADNSLPSSVSGVGFPPVNVGLLDADEAMPMLEEDDVQFRKAVQLRFESVGLDIETDEEKSEQPWESEENRKFEDVRRNLNAQQNEHYNLCAAIVKILRSDPTPMKSALIASALTQKTGAPVYEQSVVLAMRADNALRVSRGKRAVFMHILPDMWTLTENYLTRHILKIESKLYDMSRQLRIYSLHALCVKLRELSVQAWFQLSSIVLKHLSYTLIAQCTETSDDRTFIFRAEESRGLTYIPVLIKVIYKPLIETQDVIQFRELISSFGYDHGVLMSNGDVSRDALNECTAKDLPIYIYSARQIAPIMLDAKIGVIPNELPIVFIDSNFFEALSARVSDIPTADCPESDKASVPVMPCPDIPDEEDTVVDEDDVLLDEDASVKLPQFDAPQADSEPFSLTDLIYPSDKSADS